MKKLARYLLLLAAIALGFVFVSCKTDVETEYVTKEVEKTYTSAVTFTVSETNTEGVLSLTMQSATEGAVIYYTADGSTPTTDSSKYTAALTVNADAVYKAVAVKEGMENSPVSTASVSIKEKKVTVEVDKTYASAVTFTVSETNTEGVLSLTMQCATEGAVIYYTADGSTPTAESSKYTDALAVSDDAVYKAVAVKEGIENSPVSTASVSIKEKKVTVEVDKKADEAAPAPVTNLTATAKDSRVLLTWTDAADSDIYGYEVSYSGSKAINRVVLPALDSASMMVPQGAGGTYISGLTNGTEYTFTVKTVDTSGNKSEDVTVKATPVAEDASETMQIALTVSVPQENGYTGNKSNTKVTVTANITTASNVKQVVWKKDGSLSAKTLLSDTDATAVTVSDDNAKWTFDVTATDESANGTYTVAAIDEAGREETEQITIDNFDFTPPAKVKVTNAVYSSNSNAIILNWTEPGDADYDHVDISFTSNDGTSGSTASEAVSVAKGTTNNTFSSIDGEKVYYTYTFVTYDALGNKGADYTYRVSVNTSVSHIPEGFVEVTGTTITGSESWTPSSSVFVSGRSLTILDLYVCDHEVTQAEYKKYCKYGNPSSPSSTYGVGDDYPAYFVNWYDAIVYCNLRSMDEGLNPAYAISGETDPTKWSGIVGNETDGYCGPMSSNSTWNGMTFDNSAQGYRLPTEAEWEYIAREAGSSTTTYSGSNTIDDVAWYTSNSDLKTHEVKKKTANSLGIYDMSGNVSELCWDWNGSISSSTGASGASSGSARVRRGGYWNNPSYNCTVAFRSNFYPYIRNYDSGFRLVRNAY